MGSESSDTSCSSSALPPTIVTCNPINTPDSSRAGMNIGGLSVSAYSRVGTLLLVLASFLHGLALGVPVWETDHGDSYSSLWWVCLGSRCISTVSISMKVWFHAVQVLMISCAVTLLAALIGAGVHIFSPSLEKRKRRSATATFFILLAAGIQSLLAVILYGFGQVPNPDYFYTLSWGFYLALVAAILIFASSIVFYKESTRFAFRALDKRPILRHSQSVTSDIGFSLTPPPQCTVFGNRQRSESEVRLRAPSLSCSPSGPLTPEDVVGSLGLKGITEVFTPHFLPS